MWAHRRGSGRQAPALAPEGWQFRLAAGHDPRPERKQLLRGAPRRDPVLRRRAALGCDSRKRKGNAGENRQQSGSAHGSDDNHCMKLLLTYLRGYWPLVALALVLAAINQIFSLLDPLIFRHVIDQYATRFQEYTTARVLPRRQPAARRGGRRRVRLARRQELPGLLRQRHHAAARRAALLRRHPPLARAALLGVRGPAQRRDARQAAEGAHRRREADRRRRSTCCSRRSSASSS